MCCHPGKACVPNVGCTCSGADCAVTAARVGPCDIYDASGTPCVAAHSVTRALYGAYGGSLYEVQRLSDNATMAVGVTAAGTADSAGQDKFCGAATCR
jgi:hypothetical protein